MLTDGQRTMRHGISSPWSFGPDELTSVWPYQLIFLCLSTLPGLGSNAAKFFFCWLGSVKPPSAHINRSSCVMLSLFIPHLWPHNFKQNKWQHSMISVLLQWNLSWETKRILHGCVEWMSGKFHLNGKICLSNQRDSRGLDIQILTTRVEIFLTMHSTHSCLTIFLSYF